MFDIKDFISKDKSMLIAPAGYGKTHTIAECLKNIKCIKKQLVLTHTHAGVASIKEKIKRENVSNSCFEVETITSFAQKYVLSFFTGEIPKQEDSNQYYPFIIEKAIELIKLKPISQIVKNTYSGLIVDEYQDCTKKQHELILLLSELFPTHILGDFLQGIFGFNGEQLVDMINPSEMNEFSKSNYELTTPYRWLNDNNAVLGEDLKKIRELILNNQSIELKNFSSVETYIIAEADLYNPTMTYNRKIRELLSERNILILHPDSTSINPRLKFTKLFNNAFTIIESIDDKDFYKLAIEADSIIINSNKIQIIITLCKKLFNKTGVQIWFNDNGFKRKDKNEDKLKIAPIEAKVRILEDNFSFTLIAAILLDIKQLTDIKCYRRELFNSLCCALKDADQIKATVFEAMINQRNLTRRVGRKIYGRCIGTTLLTKGLEFDTVAILNAHKFNCPKHLYVALTRASKRLIVFTEKATLTPVFHDQLTLF